MHEAVIVSAVRSAVGRGKAGGALYATHPIDLSAEVMKAAVKNVGLDDLKEVVGQLGFDYSMGDGRTLQDFCPRCKRVMRGLSYATLPRRDAEVYYGTRLQEETINRDGQDGQDKRLKL